MNGMHFSAGIRPVGISRVGYLMWLPLASSETAPASLSIFFPCPVSFPLLLTFHLRSPARFCCVRSRPSSTEGTARRLRGRRRLRVWLVRHPT